MIWGFPKMVVPPKSSILIQFSIINHPFWGTPIFGNTHISPLGLLWFIVIADSSIYTGIHIDLNLYTNWWESVSSSLEYHTYRLLKWKGIQQQGSETRPPYRQELILGIVQALFQPKTAPKSTSSIFIYHKNSQHHQVSQGFISKYWYWYFYWNNLIERIIEKKRQSFPTSVSKPWLSHEPPKGPTGASSQILRISWPSAFPETSASWYSAFGSPSQDLHGIYILSDDKRSKMVWLPSRRDETVGHVLLFHIFFIASYLQESSPMVTNTSPPSVSTTGSTRRHLHHKGPFSLTYKTWEPSGS